jgi:hypothetical protein
MKNSVGLSCEMVVGLHVRHVGRVQRGWLNGGQHPDKQCTRQQKYVLAVHANHHSSNMIVNRCNAGWGGCEGARCACRPEAKMPHMRPALGHWDPTGAASSPQPRCVRATTWKTARSTHIQPDKPSTTQ